MRPNIPAIINLFNINRDDFVDEAYEVILGRTSDPSGSALYYKKLGSGSSWRRRAIILDLAHSPEARKRSSLSPLIAREALRMRRWRFLPWNRLAIALTTVLAECQRTEALLPEGHPTITQEGSRPSETAESLLLDQINQSLKGLAFAVHRLEVKL